MTLTVFHPNGSYKVYADLDDHFGQVISKHEYPVDVADAGSGDPDEDGFPDVASFDLHKHIEKYGQLSDRIDFDLLSYTDAAGRHHASLI